MNTNLITIARRLSDQALLSKVELLAQGSREVTVELIAHLAEIDRRKLHRGEGPGTLFGYCTQILRFSEAAACNRIKAARAVRRFPVILDLLAQGSVNLTTIRLLGPHLTSDNHAALLAEATGLTRRQVDKIVARLSPKPDVASSVRKLPTTTPGIIPSPDASPLSHPPPAPFAAHPPLASPRPVVAPLSPERYRLQVTIGEDAHDDLRCLQDLLRREIADGDPAAMVARALKLLRQEAEKKAFAATTRPRKSQGTRPGSRDIPADVMRKVWARDGGQCAFVASSGRRCTERSYLEYHHERAHALGGVATLDNIALRCREHNVYESELIFGAFEPAHVREDSPTYGGHLASTGPGTSRIPARKLPTPRGEAHV